MAKKKGLSASLLKLTLFLCRSNSIMEFPSSESPKQCGITPFGFIHIQIQPHNESLAALFRHHKMSYGYR